MFGRKKRKAQHSGSADTAAAGVTITGFGSSFVARVGVKANTMPGGDDVPAGEPIVMSGFEGPDGLTNGVLLPRAGGAATLKANERGQTGGLHQVDGGQADRHWSIETPGWRCAWPQGLMMEVTEASGEAAPLFRIPGVLSQLAFRGPLTADQVPTPDQVYPEEYELVDAGMESPQPWVQAAVQTANGSYVLRTYYITSTDATRFVLLRVEAIADEAARLFAVADELAAATVLT